VAYAALFIFKIKVQLIKTKRTKLTPRLRREEQVALSEKKSFPLSPFSGCGGLDLGFVGGFDYLDRTYKKLPFSIEWANDISEAACKTYRENLGMKSIAGIFGKL